jgi:hypothetical protein
VRRASTETGNFLIALALSVGASALVLLGTYALPKEPFSDQLLASKDPNPMGSNSVEIDLAQRIRVSSFAAGHAQFRWVNRANGFEPPLQRFVCQTIDKKVTLVASDEHTGYQGLGSQRFAHEPVGNLLSPRGGGSSHRTCHEHDPARFFQAAIGL